MIYDRHGNALNQAFARNGTELSEAYSVDGTVIFGATEYGIENVVSYYRQPTLDMVSTINALSDDIVSFVVITDSHGLANSQHSQAIATYIVKHSKANRLFHLGDMCRGDWNETEYKSYFTPLIENTRNQTYVACGNHEFFSGTYTTLQVIYTDFLESKRNIHGNPQHFYYYFDDSVRKLRYVFINTSDGSTDAFTNEQQAWLADSLQLPSGWQILIFGHIDIMPSDPITGAWNSRKARTITDTIKTANQPVIGYFCGHEHCDRLVKVENSFWMATLLNDSHAQDTSFEADGIINPTRTSGTVSEQAVSVVSVNLTSGDVTVRRIGASNYPNMTFNYKS